MIKPILIISALILSSSLLSGCSTMSTAVEKRNLDVQSKMSDTVFLQPTANSDKTIFIQIRNTSDRDIDTVEMTHKYIQNLTAKGFKVVDDPDQANFMLQKNILSVAKTNREEAYSALNSGYGGALAGAGVGLYTGSSYRSVAGGALVGAAIGTAANALVKDVYINTITDVQIQQRARKGQKVTTTTGATSSSGMGATTSQVVHDDTSNWITYRTRVVTVANKVNLDFDEAQPELETGLIRSVSGIF
ncbi:complement resistance protein TraT [Thiomicrospira microaerophila]|uniref:complement resistance protein TraT n=1 Tax=Thiomicrospira microaerophila TaxID=406020 RepID=UPI00200F7CEB|nr:complement resistance protein TraT [Thiomicrospira microaerophila]UQB43006.1 complement resistance protein TraT [Thiomicrospira microaerophila]